MQHALRNDAASQRASRRFLEDGASAARLELLVAGTTLQKRWKSLRDNFARELKRRKTKISGSGECIYFSRLQFLENTVSNKETTSNLDDHGQDTVILEEEEAATDDLNRPEQSTENPVGKKKIKLNPVDNHFSDILNKSILLREQRETEKNNEDEDKLFCLSLYKELKKVPEHGKIRTKIQLLETIQRALDFYNGPQLVVVQ
ncbi:uncharacterized protein LOC126184203 [Schistocerca cancellata]|uniref:uncharacterized protein LOC126184203 n=1 Tax=Schistocerca cancellata TaxID=274614 RepID=UPI0021176AFF|nr:uncharacterized protein LOC126184203 [Schistocerca cancellata]